MSHIKLLFFLFGLPILFFLSFVYLTDRIMQTKTIVSIDSKHISKKFFLPLGETHLLTLMTKRDDIYSGTLIIKRNNKIVYESKINNTQYSEIDTETNLERHDIFDNEKGFRVLKPVSLLQSFGLIERESYEITINFTKKPTSNAYIELFWFKRYLGL